MIELVHEKKAGELLAKFAREEGLEVLESASESKADFVLRDTEGKRYFIWMRTQYTPEEHSILLETRPEQENGGLEAIEELSQKMEEELKEIDPQATVVVLRLAQPDPVLEDYFRDVLAPRLKPLGEFEFSPFGGPTEAGKYVYAIWFGNWFSQAHVVRAGLGIVGVSRRLACFGARIPCWRVRFSDGLSVSSEMIWGGRLIFFGDPDQKLWRFIHRVRIRKHLGDIGGETNHQPAEAFPPRANPPHLQAPQIIFGPQIILHLWCNLLHQ